MAGHPLCFRLLGQDFEPFSVLFLEFGESPRLLWAGSELFMFSRRIPQPVWELSGVSLERSTTLWPFPSPRVLHLPFVCRKTLVKE